MLDIRRLPTNEDIAEPTQNEKQYLDNMDDLLNEFMTGNGDEESWKNLTTYKELEKKKIYLEKNSQS